jgi:hypothetical protein
MARHSTQSAKESGMCRRMEFSLGLYRDADLSTTGISG